MSGELVSNGWRALGLAWPVGGSLRQKEVVQLRGSSVRSWIRLNGGGLEKSGSKILCLINGEQTKQSQTKQSQTKQSQIAKNSQTKQSQTK